MLFCCFVGFCFVLYSVCICFSYVCFGFVGFGSKQHQNNSKQNRQQWQTITSTIMSFSTLFLLFCWFCFVLYGNCICFSYVLFRFVGLVQNNIKTTANKTDNSKNNKNLTIMSFSTLFFGFVVFVWFCIVFCLCFD